MNVTNISTPAPTPAPAPAPSSSSTPMTTTTNLLSNALSIACEIPIEETNIMSFLDLREFLMTACTVVVFLTTLNALQGTLLKASKRIQRYFSDRKKKSKKTSKKKSHLVARIVKLHQVTKQKKNQLRYKMRKVLMMI